MSILTVIIPGEPVGKGRPKFTSVGGFGRAYTPAKTARWETRAAKTIATAWRALGNTVPVERPVTVKVLAVAERPKRLQRKKDPSGQMWRAEKPDADNCAKAALDALQKAGVVSDDKVVVRLEVWSLYVAKGQEPHVAIYVTDCLDVPVEAWYEGIVYSTNWSPT